MGAGPSGLAFRVAESRLDGDLVGRQFTLRGKWQADARNRLRFEVDGQTGRHRGLTLEGGWEIGPHHELLYRLQRSQPRAERRQIHLLRFQGHWDVGRDRRLTYVLDADSDSAFRFRGTFQTPMILPKAGQLRYQVGVELEGREVLRTITLFGRWKLSRALGFSFEVPYRDGEVRAIDFSAVLRMRQDGELSARLLTREGRPLGLEIILTQSFMQRQGEAFVRLRKLAEETAMEGGLRLRW